MTAADLTRAKCRWAFKNTGPCYVNNHVDNPVNIVEHPQIAIVMKVFRKRCATNLHIKQIKIGIWTIVIFKVQIVTNLYSIYSYKDAIVWFRDLIIPLWSVYSSGWILNIFEANGQWQERSFMAFRLLIPLSSGGHFQMHCLVCHEIDLVIMFQRCISNQSCIWVLFKSTG